MASTPSAAAAPLGAAATSAGGDTPNDTRQKLIELMVNLLKKKPEATGEVEKRVQMGRSITVKGFVIEASSLSEALRRFKSLTPTAPATVVSQNPSVAPVATPSGASASSTSAVAAKQSSSASTWAAPAPSSAALASKAVSECESAEPFCRTITVIGSNKVAVLAKPNAQSQPTGEYLRGGEAVEVIARAVMWRDGRVYLRCRTYTGWVSTRSRKDFSKVVLAAAPNSAGPPLEPPSVTAALASRATQILRPVDEEGREDKSHGDPSLTAREPAQFRAIGSRCQILSAPSMTGSACMAGIVMRNKEEFTASGVHMNASEGRAYLRLADGRGWVCERLRADFSKFAVQPADMTSADTGTVDIDEGHDFLDLGPSAKATTTQLGGSSRRVMVRERPSAVDASAIKAAAAALPEQPKEPTKVVYRSDSELWPEPSGKGLPISREVRVQLRRLFRNYGERIRGCEVDMKEATTRADTYQRACDASRSLRAHADALEKEIAQVRKEWAKAVEKAFVDAGEPAPGSDGVHGADSAERRPSGIQPVQIQGARWYCAILRPDCSQDDADAAAEKVTDKSSGRYLGPLRRTTAEASADFQVMRKRCLLNDHGTPAEEPVQKRRKAAAVCVAGG